MPGRRPHPRSRSLGSGAALLCAALLATAPMLASCTYSYDDGLPPLGERATPSAPPQERFVPGPSNAATDPPIRDWTPDMVTSWALATIPDSNGVSYAFGYGVALPNGPVLATAAIPDGTLVLEYSCRGASTGHLKLSVGGADLVDSEYDCGRVWVHTIVVEDGAVAEIRATAAHGAPSAYAFRIVKR